MVAAGVVGTANAGSPAWAASANSVLASGKNVAPMDAVVVAGNVPATTTHARTVSAFAHPTVKARSAVRPDVARPVAHVGAARYARRGPALTTLVTRRSAETTAVGVPVGRAIAENPATMVPASTTLAMARNVGLTVVATPVAPAPELRKSASTGIVSACLSVKVRSADPMGVGVPAENALALKIHAWAEIVSANRIVLPRSAEMTVVQVPVVSAACSPVPIAQFKASVIASPVAQTMNVETTTAAETVAPAVVAKSASWASVFSWHALRKNVVMMDAMELVAIVHQSSSVSMAAANRNGGLTPRRG
jgi:hypothetical protein